MYDNVVALYCITDDLLKAINHHDDCRRQLSDAEVITTAFHGFFISVAISTLLAPFLQHPALCQDAQQISSVPSVASG